MLFCFSQEGPWFSFRLKRDFFLMGFIAAKLFVIWFILSYLVPSAHCCQIMAQSKTSSFAKAWVGPHQTSYWSYLSYFWAHHTSYLSYLKGVFLNGSTTPKTNLHFYCLAPTGALLSIHSDQFLNFHSPHWEVNADWSWLMLKKATSLWNRIIACLAQPLLQMISIH